MTPGILDLAKIVEVDGIGQGSKNSTARWCAAMVRSLLVRSPSRGHTGEREREVGGGGWRPGVGGGWRPVKEGLVEMCCALLSWGPLFI
jgi:hypothetical protein